MRKRVRAVHYIVLALFVSSGFNASSTSLVNCTQSVSSYGMISYPRVRMIAWYYLWWPSSPPGFDWDEAYRKDLPLLGKYGVNSTVMETHIDLAKSAGIDAFAISVDYKEPILVTLADIAAEKRFKLCFLGEFADQTMSWIEQYIRYLITTFKDKPACNWTDGKILILCYDDLPHRHTFEEWCTLLETLRADGVDASFLWLAKNESEEEVHAVLTVFDGLFTTGVYKPYEFEQIQKLGRYVHSYPKPKIWCPHILPGYDDTLLALRRDRSPLVIERSEEYYRGTFSCALGSDPDMISVVTWNDFWENTYIEPSVNYGFFYLNLTKEFVFTSPPS